MRGRLLERLAGRPATPTTVGRFEILRRRGAGAFGVVFDARDPELRREVAVKVVSAGPDDRAVLRREAEAAARVSHPNVIDVYDVGETDGSVYIAMELVDGDTLARYDDARWGWRQVVSAYLQAARGLAAAHDAGLIHRDFKPSNALVGDDGRVRVIDFGLARRGEETSAGSERDDESGQTPESRSTLTAGTPVFMAPEQHRGEALDGRCDQFALCVALWTALYERRPFVGETPVALALAKAAAPADPGPGPRRVPRAVRRALERGLQPDRSGRFASMRALADALERAARGRARWPAALLGVTGVVVLGAVVWDPDPALASCKPDRAPIGYDEASRFAVRQAVARAGGAQPVATTVLAEIEAGIESWAGAYALTCREHEAGSLPDAQFDARIACLRTVRERLAATVEAAALIDAATIARGRTGVVLPVADACLSTEQAPPPAAMARRVQAVFAEIARADALRAAGRVAEAKAAAAAAVDEARATGYPPVIAAGHLALGRAGVAAAIPDATADLEHAYDIALSLGDSRLEADAALALTHAHGALRSDPAAAERWSGAARAAVARLGDPPGLVARLANDHGLALWAAGDLAGAQRELELAVRLQAQTKGRGHPDVATTQLNLGTILYWQGEISGAKARFEEALEALQRSLGPEHAHVARALTNLGNVAFRNDEPDRARDYHARALTIYEAALGPDHAEVANGLGNLAIVAQVTGDLDEAEQLLTRALEIRIASAGAEHTSVADTYTTLGAVAASRGDLEGSAAHHRRAREIYAEAYGSAHPDWARATLNLAAVYSDQGQLANARRYYEDAMTAMRASATTDHADYLVALADLAAVELRDERAAAGCRYAEEAQAGSDRESASAWIRAAVSFSLARCRAAQGEGSAARALAERARDLYREAGPAYEAQLDDVVRWLATAAEHDADGDGP